MEDVKLGIYMHYKGNYYRVWFVARHSETKEELVVYEALRDHSFWARPKKMFLEEVDVEGKRVPRFKYVGEKHD